MRSNEQDFSENVARVSRKSLLEQRNFLQAERGVGHPGRDAQLRMRAQTRAKTVTLEKKPVDTGEILTAFGESLARKRSGKEHRLWLNN